MGDIVQVALFIILLVAIVTGFVAFLGGLGRDVIRRANEPDDLRVFPAEERPRGGSVRSEKNLDVIVGQSNDEWLARRREQDLYRKRVRGVHAAQSSATVGQSPKPPAGSRLSREALERQEQLRINQGKLSAMTEGKANQRDVEGILEAKGRARKQEMKERYRNQRFFVSKSHSV